VALHHLAGDLDVDGVDVVEEAWGEEAADLEDEPGEDEDCDGAWAPKAARCGLIFSSQWLVLNLRSSLVGLSLCLFAV
jgi:hypothetical protein